MWVWVRFLPTCTSWYDVIAWNLQPHGAYSTNSAKVIQTACRTKKVELLLLFLQVHAFPNSMALILHASLRYNSLSGTYSYSSHTSRPTPLHVDRKIRMFREAKRSESRPPKQLEYVGSASTGESMED
jgi:hypothetical protein